MRKNSFATLNVTRQVLKIDFEVFLALQQKDSKSRPAINQLKLGGVFLEPATNE